MIITITVFKIFYIKWIRTLTEFMPFVDSIMFMPHDKFRSE